MTTVQSIYNAINSFAPFNTAEEFDNVGLLIGSAEKPVHKVAVALDATLDTLATAATGGADVLVTHHPIIFDGLKSIPADEPASRAIADDIAVICAHTNFDIASGGLSDEMTKVFELSDVTCGGCVYRGLFDGSAEDLLAIAQKTYGNMRYFISEKNKTPPLSVGVCSGGGFDYFSEDFDLFVTGDVRHHQWLLARQKGVSLLDCGHYGTEIAFERLMSAKLEEFGFEVIRCNQKAPFCEK
jgi:dinuclear metal center protein, YbgI/SA1388 family